MTSSWLRQVRSGEGPCSSQVGWPLSRHSFEPRRGALVGTEGRAVWPWECHFPSLAGLVVYAEVHSRGPPAWAC